MPLKVSDGIGAWIKDFKKSDAPQFKGKSEKERRDQAIAAYLSAKRGDKNEDAFTKKAVETGKVKTGASKSRMAAMQKQDDNRPTLRKNKTNEEFVFKVDVEGLPSMFMKGNSPGEVKTHLRKLVKQPSMVKSVERQTKHDVKKARRKQAVVGEAKSADVKPEKYIGKDGKTKIRMVPVTKEAMNRRDRLRAKLAAVGKDMKKSNDELKKTVGIKDKPEPYKGKYFTKEEMPHSQDWGKPGSTKRAKEITPGEKNEKLTFAKVRKGLYKTAKAMGDVQAVRKKKVGKRIKRRVLGKLAGKALGALTR